MDFVNVVKNGDRQVAQIAFNDDMIAIVAAMLEEKPSLCRPISATRTSRTSSMQECIRLRSIDCVLNSWLIKTECSSGISASSRSTFLGEGTHPHMVQPGMVYISMPTEFGMVYTKAELESLYATCHQYGCPHLRYIQKAWHSDSLRLANKSTVRCSAQKTLRGTLTEGGF